MGFSSFLKANCNISIVILQRLRFILRGLFEFYYVLWYNIHIIFIKGGCRVTWLFEKILDLIAALLSFLFLFLFHLIEGAVAISPDYSGENSTLFLAMKTFPMLKTTFILMKYTAFFIMVIMFIYHIIKSFFGNKIAQVEHPYQLAIKYLFYSFLVFMSSPICNAFFVIASAPYSAFKSMEGPPLEKFNLMDTIAYRVTGGEDAIIQNIEDVASLLITPNAAMLFILLILLCAIAIEFFKLSVELFERYVLLTAFSVFSPICIAMGAFASTEIIAKTWFRMMVSNCVMMIVNLIFIKVFISSFGRMGEPRKGFLMTTILLLGWLIVGQKADTHLSALGLTTARSGGLGHSLMMAYRMAGEASASTTNKIFGAASNTKLGKMMGVQNPHMTTIRSRVGQNVQGSETGEKYTSPLNIFGRNGISRGVGLQLSGNGNPAAEINAFNRVRRMVDPQGTVGGGLRSIFNGEVGENSKSQKTKENGEAILSNFSKDKTGNIQKLQDTGFQLEGGMAKAGMYELSGKDAHGNDITATIKDKKDDQHNIPITANDGSEKFMAVRSGQGINSEVTKAFSGEGNMNMKETAGSIMPNGSVVEADQSMSENKNDLHSKEANPESLEGKGNVLSMKDGSIALAEADSTGSPLRFDKKGKIDPNGEYFKNAENGSLISENDVNNAGYVDMGNRNNVSITDGRFVLSADGSDNKEMADKIKGGMQDASLERNPITGNAVGYKLNNEGEMQAVAPGDNASASHFKATLSDGTTGFVPKTDVGIASTMMKDGMLQGEFGVGINEPTTQYKAGDKKNLEVDNNGNLQGYINQGDTMVKTDNILSATHFRNKDSNETFIPVNNVGQKMTTKGNAVDSTGNIVSGFDTSNPVSVQKNGVGIAREYAMGSSGKMEPAPTGQGTHYMAISSGGQEGYVSKKDTGLSATVSKGFTGYSESGAISPSFNRSVTNSAGQVTLQPTIDGREAQRFNLVGGQMREARGGEYIKATTSDGNSGYLKASGNDGIPSYGLSAGSVMEKVNDDGTTSYYRPMANGSVGVTSNQAEAYATTPLQSGTLLKDNGSGTNSGHFALGANSFDSSGNLRVYQDSSGESYINDNRGVAHAVSDIQKNDYQGFSTFSGGNTGTHVQTESGLRYVQGGSENIAGVQTYTQNPVTNAFEVSKTNEGTHVMVASHVGEPVYERLAEGQINDQGQVRTYNFRSESGGSDISFATSSYKEGASLNPTTSYTASSSGGYYKDNSGNYRSVANVSMDSSGEMMRYEKTASGYALSSSGSYVAETRTNEAGQSRISMVKIGSSQRYDATSFLAGVPLDSGGNISFPADTEFTNVDKGVYTANYGNGRQTTFFNDEIYKESGKFDSSNAVKIQIGDAGFYAVDTSPTGAGLSKTNTYEQSNAYMDMNQFSGGRVTYRGSDGKTYSENQSTIDATSSDNGVLKVNYNKGTAQGALLYDAAIYTPRGNDNYPKVSSRDGREYYMIGLDESGNISGKASFSKKGTSPIDVAKKQFSDKSYNKVVTGETSVTKKQNYNPKSPTDNNADEAYVDRELTLDMMYYGDDDYNFDREY